MTVSENPTAEEIAAALHKSALIWACEYYDDETADQFADWYSRVQPSGDFNKAFQTFGAGRDEY
jgi:hypothetical protein